MAAAELQALEELRRRVHQRVVHPRFHDVMLLRFLRARNFDVEAAWTLFSAHLDWRHSIGMDGDALVALQELDLEQMSILQRCYPHGYHGTDREGRPVYIERLGLANFPELLARLSLERIMQHFILDTEHTVTHRFLACSIARNRLVDKSVTILDLGGLGMNKAAWDILSQRTKMLQNHYPDTLGQMLIVNAPRTFSFTWSLVKTVLDPKTVKKIKIFSGGQDQRVALEALIGSDDLPTFIGGECTCGDSSCLSSGKGPWQHPDIVAKLASTPNWELWDLFGPQQCQRSSLVSLPAKLATEDVMQLVATGGSSTQVASSTGYQGTHSQPMSSPAEGLAISFPCQPELYIADTNLVAFDAKDYNELSGHLPISIAKEKKMHLSGKSKRQSPSLAVWRRQRRVLEDGYVRILQDMLARVPRQELNSWHLHTKHYFDVLVALHHSKAIVDDIALKFNEVMGEHERLKKELKLVECKLMSLSHQRHHAQDVHVQAKSVEKEDADATQAFLAKSLKLSLLTNDVMAAQAHRDQLHLEFKHELERLTLAQLNAQKMQKRPGGCCFGRPDVKAKAYMQLESALREVVADLELDTVICTSPVKIVCAASPEETTNFDDVQYHREDRSCVSCPEDLGAASETASFYSCDAGDD